MWLITNYLQKWLRCYPSRFEPVAGLNGDSYYYIPPTDSVNRKPTHTSADCFNVECEVKQVSRFIENRRIIRLPSKAALLNDKFASASSISATSPAASIIKLL